MLARWAMGALVTGALVAASDPRSAELVRTVTFREFGIASVSAFAVTLAWAEARGLVLVLTLATLTIGVRILAHQRLGGATADAAGAAGALGEALVLGICALTA
jgi:cobalamin synthase